MFDWIRFRIDAWRMKRLAKKEFGASSLKLNTSLPSTTYFEIWQESDNDKSLMFSGNDGETIFSINQSGEAKWHKEDKYNEAASIFLSHMNMQIESVAGIKRNRQEWEQRIGQALVKEAEKQPLTADVLTDVLNKCIMYDKLKGTDIETE